MKRQTIDAILKKAGVKVAPDDDPRYSESLSISFLSRTPRPTLRSGTDHPVYSEPSSVRFSSGANDAWLARGELTLPAHSDMESIDADEELDAEGACPYCQCTDSCEHHLLTIDCTFGEVLGGAAFEWFSSSREKDKKNDGTEHESNDWRTHAVEAVCDWECYEEAEGGPGQSSLLRHFYCAIGQATQDAVAKLVANERTEPHEPPP